MGVVHKLKPEVLSFIIENKQNNPTISCRHLTLLILEQLHIKVSKSSINAVFKDNNLSMPIGRRRKQRKKKFNMPVLPVIETTQKTRLGELPQEFAQEQKGIENKDSLEEARLRELERLAQEAEEKRKKEEEARKLEEEKATQELAKIKALEQARLIELERLAQEAEENMRREEEALRLREERESRETELKTERERWARLAAEEQRSRQQEDNKVEKKEEVVIPEPENEPVTPIIFPEERVCSGVMILKALDYLIGGSKEINALVSRAIGSKPEETIKLTESLIFRSLFNKDSHSNISDLVGVKYSKEKISSYYGQIKQITDIGLDAVKIISKAFTEAKGVKVNFIDGSVSHLDGQLYSTWPATRFPYNFSNTLIGLKKDLDKSFIQGEPLVLFSPPGYDIFPKDFFNLLLNISSKDNYPDSLTLYGNQSEELEKISLSKEKRCGLVFGLWPWQFNSSRKVRKIGDFNSRYIKGVERDLYLGEIEIDLFRASLNQKITLKGCAVKIDPKEKIRLVIMSSDEQLAANLDDLASIYLSHWPNFEEAFQDFSRKIELFTYAGTEQRFFSKDGFGLDVSGVTMELTEIFATYIKILDAYLRWHFLPSEYLDKDLSSTSDNFYKIPVKLVPNQNRIRVKTLISQDYQFLKDLEYLNCRLNERQINSDNDKMFWFESAFK